MTETETETVVHCRRCGSTSISEYQQAIVCTPGPFVRKGPLVRQVDHATGEISDWMDEVWWVCDLCGERHDHESDLLDAPEPPSEEAVLEAFRLGLQEAEYSITTHFPDGSPLADAYEAGRRAGFAVYQIA